MKVRRWTSVILVLLLLLSLTACGSNSGAASDNYYAESEQSAPSFSKENTDSMSTALPQDRKLIRTLTIQAETEDLDEILEILTQRIADLGGYVQEKNLHNGSAYASRRYRSVTMTIRIPAENVDSFVEQIGGVSNIVSSNETVQDVTLQYVDTESRVKALETERDRLMALLEQAESLEAILQIEERLSDVCYELESYASQLRTLENQVSYATVKLTVSEVQEYTPVEEETAWQRITGGFMDSLESIGEGAVEAVIWILANSPYLVIYGVVGFLVIRIVRKNRKKKHALPTEETKPEE